MRIFPGSLVSKQVLALKDRWIAYHSKLRTGRLYVKEVTPVSPYSLILFAGNNMQDDAAGSGDVVEVKHGLNEAVVDGWIRFSVSAKTAVLLKELRKSLDRLLKRKIRGAALKKKKKKLESKSEDDQSSNVIETIVQLLSSEI